MITARLLKLHHFFPIQITLWSTFFGETKTLAKSKHTGIKFCSLDILIGGDVCTSDLFNHLLGDPPQGEAAVPRPGDQELVVKPGLIEDPVVVRVLSHADWVKGG